MKFMKLGSKPDLFQTEGDNIRYVATELASDIVVNIGDVRFYLHKFPLRSKSARLQKLVATTNEEDSDEIHIQDIPGGPAAFDICAKFCYGMTVTLNAYNVIAARCAAEYLEMYETVEKGNLIYKIEVFLNSSIFRSWKDLIIVLQTTNSFLPWSEELKVVSRCLDSIASKASVDTSKVDWSYTYNRKKLSSENGNEPHWNGVIKPHRVPNDWWVEDLCELQVDFYKRVISTIKAKGKISGEVIGEALHAYAFRRLSGFEESIKQGCDVTRYISLTQTIIWLLPTEKGSVGCSFLLNLFRAAILLGCGDVERKELMRRIGQQLEEASVDDLLIRSPSGKTEAYDIDIVENLVEEFVAQEQNFYVDSTADHKFQEIRSPKFVPDTSKMMVAKLVDGYLAEVARDPKLPLSKFVNIAEMVSSFTRPSHDGLYRAIDMYLKEHPEISKSERKRICRLMDCRKLSAEACMHAVQNERLPLRVVVQVLFFEQVKAATSSAGNSTPEIPGSLGSLLSGGSHGSSRSTLTNTDEELDGKATSEDIKALKGELATLKLGYGASKYTGHGGAKSNAEKVDATKMKGLRKSKIFSKLWSSKDKHGETSSSETSESLASTSAEDAKSTPLRRH